MIFAIFIFSNGFIFDFCSFFFPLWFRIQMRFVTNDFNGNTKYGSKFEKLFTEKKNLRHSFRFFCFAHKERAFLNEFHLLLIRERKLSENEIKISTQWTHRERIYIVCEYEKWRVHSVICVFFWIWFFFYFCCSRF